MLTSRRKAGPLVKNTLTPLPGGEVMAWNMESVAVLKAEPERFSQLTFSSGGDDFDDFEGAVVKSASLGPFGVLRYHGQPSGTLSVVAPSGVSSARINRLVDLVLKLGDLREAAIEWSLRPRPRVAKIASQRHPSKPRSVATPRRAMG